MKTFAKIWLGLMAVVSLWTLVFHPFYLLLGVVFAFGGGAFTWHCIKEVFASAPISGEGPDAQLDIGLDNNYLRRAVDLPQELQDVR